MNFLRHSMQTLLLLAASTSALCATWEETDGEYFRRGDLTAVKRILSKESYSGDLLIQAFQTAVMSGNIELVEYLGKRGWVKTCRRDKSCAPVVYAALSKSPKMVKHVLSLGFAPAREALFFASAAVNPDDASVSNNLESVRLLCDNGANPGERQEHKEGSTVRTGLTVVEELEKRITDPVMDLGSPLSSARGIAAEAQVAEFFKKGACKKGATSSTDLDDYLVLVRAMRGGTAEIKIPAVLDKLQFRPQVERYLLYEVIASGNLDLLAQLKSRGWISRCRKEAACRPVDIAGEVGANSEILQFLASEGFELDSRNTSGGTPLMYAALHAQISPVKFLCENGADFRKRVKLEVYERSIVSIVRRSYGHAWCSSVLFGTHSKTIRDEVRGRCEGEEGGLGGPQSFVAVPECEPGTTCMSIPFPPKGRENDIRNLKALAEIFQYFKNGGCKSAQVAATCTADVAPAAVLIGRHVQLRAEPSVTSTKIETLPFGTVVKLLDGPHSCESVSGRAGQWIKIRADAYPQSTDQRQPGIEGWVFDAYVDYFPSFEP
jgi:hypothetical protein